MLSRHSLFWKLAILLVGFCLLMIVLSWQRASSALSGKRQDEVRCMRLILLAA